MSSPLPSPKQRATSSADPIRGLPLEALTFEQIAAANRQAQLDGVGVGGLAGFLGGSVSHRVFRQSRNTALLSGLLTAATAGYIFTQTALKVHLAKASVNAQVLRDSLDKEGVERAWANEREGGVVGSGLEGLEDKYATTRGDH